nr:unnamed protein product [Callosobruchus analis]
MRKAAEAVENREMGNLKASKSVNVPKNTLIDYVRSKRRPKTFVRYRHIQKQDQINHHNQVARAQIMKVEQNGARQLFSLQRHIKVN